MKYYPLGTTTATTIAAGNITVETQGGADDFVTAITVLNQCAANCAVGAYKFEIIGLKNPNFMDTGLTGDFTVQTTDSTDGVVDRSKNTTSVGKILPHPFTTVPTLDRSIGTLGQSVNLTMSFTTDYVSYGSPTSGSIIIALPTDMIKFASTGAVSVETSTGTPLTPSSVVINSTYTLITIPNWCTTGSGGACTAATAFSLKIKGGTNPVQLIGNTSPNSAQIFTTTSTSSGGYVIEGYYSALKPTTILEGAAILINDISISSGLVNQDDVFTIDFNPITPMASTDRIYLYFPDGQFQAPSSPLCKGAVPTTST